VRREKVGIIFQIYIGASITDNKLAGFTLTNKLSEENMAYPTIQFDELMEKYENALRVAGFGYGTRLRILSRANGLVHLHERKLSQCLNPEIVSEYCRDFDRRLYEGKIGLPYHRDLMRDVQRFLRYAEYGTVEQPSPLKGCRYVVLPEFERISDAYLASGDFHPNTRNDMRWVAHKYFVWLAEHGHEDLARVGAVEVQGFLLDCSRRMTSNSMHNVRLHLKKLYAYLYKAELSESSYAHLLSFRVNRESRIYPALPMSDVAKLLGAIDRGSKSGKRKFAIMVLGADLGMRACDIVGLKLGDINWIRGEIRMLQAKTRRSAVLPLTQKVGDALSDYILNARPHTDEQNVFLRFNKPHTPLKAAVTIGEIYRDCCNAAGIPSNKSFHTLRRSLATAMVTGGVDAPTVAQVLCDAQIDSIKKYVALDSKHLARCALSFDGIAPIGGIAQ
jgi:site-specific recombinase XerD